MGILGSPGALEILGVSSLGALKNIRESLGKNEHLK